MGGGQLPGAALGAAQLTDLSLRQTKKLPRLREAEQRYEETRSSHPGLFWQIAVLVRYIL